MDVPKRAKSTMLMVSLWVFYRSLFFGGYFLAKGRRGLSGNASDTLQKAPGYHGEFTYFKGQLYFNTSLWKSFLGQDMKNWNMENCWSRNYSHLQAYIGIFKLSFKTRRQKNTIA